MKRGLEDLHHVPAHAEQSARREGLGDVRRGGAPVKAPRARLRKGGLGDSGLARLAARL